MKEHEGHKVFLLSSSKHRVQLAFVAFVASYPELKRLAYIKSPFVFTKKLSAL
jgi:hypothetical protein